MGDFGENCLKIKSHLIYDKFQMYSEAEDAFTQVLKLDKNCDDAVQELLRVRIHQIEVSW